MRKKLREEVKKVRTKSSKAPKVGQPRSRKRKASEIREPDSFPLDLPVSLMKKLVKERNKISEKYLVVLPCSPTVAEILDKYAASQDPTGNPSFDEVVEGTKRYFDKALGTMLLYKFERVQYMEITKKNADKSPSEIYGADHLLRLFGQIIINLKKKLIFSLHFQ